MRSHWLLAAGLAGSCLAAQVPPQPAAVAAIDAYVRRIDANKALRLKRHLHTYGHPTKPGADSLFWVFHTDHPFSSANVYFADNQIVKIVETARAGSFFSEYSYYLQHSRLLFVKNRQVTCPALVQGNAWRSNTLPCVRSGDCFFKAAYYFAGDSCINQQKWGKSRWTPEYQIPGGGGRYAMPPDFFPLQAARYAVCFPHPPAPKRR